MKKESLLKYIRDKKVIVFGTGERGNRFYEKYKDTIDIVYATSNLDNKTIGNLERIEWKNITGEDKYLLVICSVAENDIAYQLMLYGLVYGKDFITQNVVEVLLDGKKLVLFVGQCELEIVNDILNGISEFKDKYVGICYREYDVLGIGERTPKLQISFMVNFVIGLADYYVYPANLSKERLEYYEMLLGKTAPYCKTCSVPLTTFEAYWPQDSKNYYEMPPLYKRDSSGALPFGGRRDNNLELAVYDGTVQKTIDEILKDDFYTDDTINKLFSKTIRKYKVLEKKSDIKISDFLEENYRKRRVFLDRGHACDFILKEYAKRIVTYLDINIDVGLIGKIDLETYNQCHSEQPIYVSVKKHLEFQENTQYRFWMNGKMQYAAAEVYFNILCNYMGKVKALDMVGVKEGNEKENNMFSE